MRKAIYFLSLLTYASISFYAISCGQLLASTTSSIRYYYNASGQVVNEENDNNVSSYLTHGIRYNGTSGTYAVSNKKDVMALLDANGNVSKKYNYSPYGVPIAYSDSFLNPKFKTSTDVLGITQNPYTYSGYYTDSESGNYYLNARYYNPVIGSFLTMDSYNMPNRYMYVNGNPVMMVDPTGHIVQKLRELWQKTTNFFRKDISGKKNYLFIDNSGFDKRNRELMNSHDNRTINDWMKQSAKEISNHHTSSEAEAVYLYRGTTYKFYKDGIGNKADLANHELSMATKLEYQDREIIGKDKSIFSQPFLTKVEKGEDNDTLEVAQKLDNAGMKMIDLIKTHNASTVNDNMGYNKKSKAWEILDFGLCYDQESCTFIKTRVDAYEINMIATSMKKHIEQILSL